MLCISFDVYYVAHTFGIFNYLNGLLYITIFIFNLDDHILMIDSSSFDLIALSVTIHLKIINPRIPIIINFILIINLLFIIFFCDYLWAAKCFKLLCTHQHSLLLQVH